MVTKFVALWLVACNFSNALAANAGSDPQGVEESRESGKVEVDAGFRHVEKIREPKRAIEASRIGLAHLIAASPRIQVVGSISNQQVGSILADIHERYGDRAKRVTRVTGDAQYAVVELGDRTTDPCCFATFLFVNRDGSWVMLTAISISH